MVKDIEELFEQPSLKKILERLKVAQEEKDPILDAINQGQNAVSILEVNWHTKRCYAKCLIRAHSLAWIKNMVKSLLMEHYGARAMPLQIVIVDNH